MVTFYLHDVVYLYLRILNQTLAEGNLDYRDGRLIRNKTIGQRFTGERFATIWLYGFKLTLDLIVICLMWSGRQRTVHLHYSVRLCSHFRDVKSSRPVWHRGQIFRPRPRPRCVWPRPRPRLHGLWPRLHRSWPRGLVNEQRNVLLKLCITSWLIKLLSGNLYTFISGCLLKS